MIYRYSQVFVSLISCIFVLRKGPAMWLRQSLSIQSPSLKLLILIIGVCYLLQLVQLKIFSINPPKLNKFSVETLILIFKIILNLREVKSIVYLLAFVYNCCFDKSIPICFFSTIQSSTDFSTNNLFWSRSHKV